MCHYLVEKQGCTQGGHSFLQRFNVRLQLGDSLGWVALHCLARFSGKTPVEVQPGGFPQQGFSNEWLVKFQTTLI